MVLADVDGLSGSWGALVGAVGGGEGQFVVRDGVVRVPRFERVGRVSEAVGGGVVAGGLDGAGVAGGDGDGVVGGVVFDVGGTVLVTGATGGLGRLVVRHLVGVLGVRSVLLLSRSGRGAPGVGEFEAALVGLGARVVIEACDVSDREQLQAVLGLVPEEFPLRGVIHLAGIIDDGLVEGLSVERVERVLAPKLDAAWYLHELTAEMDLSAFVLFSSAAGVLGAPGQGSYAAGNVFLDALAWYRRARGLAGLSIAWGLWALDGLGGTLSEDDIARVERSGVGMFSAEEGLERFDAACRSGRAMLVPVRLQMSALRAQARAGVLPGLLRGLVRVPTQRAGEHAGDSLSRRLAGVGEAEREGVVLEVVRGEVAAVLGLTSAEEVAPGRSFSELGFTSLSAVELRNRLNAATGLRLPATLIFDHPTPTTLATHLNTQLTGGDVDASLMETELKKFERMLSAADAQEEQRRRIATRLRAFLSDWDATAANGEVVADEEVDEVSDEAIFDLLDSELGTV